MRLEGLEFKLLTSSDDATLTLYLQVCFGTLQKVGSASNTSLQLQDAVSWP
jgi:hypothetical protein